MSQQKYQRSAAQLQQIVANRTGVIVHVSPIEEGWTAQILVVPHGQRRGQRVGGDATSLVERTVAELNRAYELQH